MTEKKHRTYVVYRALDSKPVDVIESVRNISLGNDLIRIFTEQEQYYPTAIYPVVGFYFKQEELD